MKKTVYTKWASDLDRKHPHPEYPRPQLVRKGWMNLNGEWEYQIVKGEENTHPDKWQKILVPFALGTALSGAEEILQPDETLWYRRTFAWHPGQKRTILHFEAVDQECTVYLNGFETGHHKGGYTPFEMDVSQYIKYQNALMVKVRDYSDTDVYAYGKQRQKTGGIWYTPTAGIWGTVWMEELPEHAVELLLKDSSITAVAAYSDDQALDIIHQLRLAGRRVPEDVSVIGFNDGPLAERPEFQLTTIAQQRLELGHTAVQCLLEMIRNPGVRMENRYLEPKLVLRATTKKIA